MKRVRGVESAKTDRKTRGQEKNDSSNNNSTDRTTRSGRAQASETDRTPTTTTTSGGRRGQSGSETTKSGSDTDRTSRRGRTGSIGESDRTTRSGRTGGETERTTKTGRTGSISETDRNPKTGGETDRTTRSGRTGSISETDRTTETDRPTKSSKPTTSSAGTSKQMKLDANLEDKKAAAAKAAEDKKAAAVKAVEDKMEALFKDEDKDDEKENVSLEDYYLQVKRDGIVSERWIIHEPMQDPSAKQLCMLVTELDITMEGDLRTKRCVKIFEDRSIRVLLDNNDMTHLFDLNKKVRTTQDYMQLLCNVLMKKVCQGIRTYDPWSPTCKGKYPVKQRGNLWYSKDCTVIVQKVFMGNSCSACARIRNQIKRKLVVDTRKKTVKPPAKVVKSTFGKAVYSTLNEFLGKGPVPPSQFARVNMVFDPKLEIHVPQEMKDRLEMAASMPPPPPPPPKLSRAAARKRSKSGRGQPRFYQGAIDQVPVHEYITEDGQICYVTNVLTDASNTMTTGHPGLVNYMPWGQVMEQRQDNIQEYVTINDQGEYIIQNVQGEQFQLAEGQEYELIGEAPPTIDPVEILPADNQQIEIIELDDETMSQIHVHESMDNMQIATVDPNDPNFSQILRAFQAQGLIL